VIRSYGIGGASGVRFVERSYGVGELVVLGLWYEAMVSGR